MKDLSILTLNNKDINDFANERNELLKTVKTKWVLFIDGDEKLSSPIKNISESYDGYILKRKNYFLRDYVGTDKIIRLAKKDAGKWKRAVHETWQIDSGKVGELDEFIIHNTAESLLSYLNKMNHYSGLHAKANLNEGKRSNLLKIIFFSIGKFIVTFFKSRHVTFSIIQSLHSYLSWTKLYFLQHS